MLQPQQVASCLFLPRDCGFSTFCNNEIKSGKPEGVNDNFLVRQLAVLVFTNIYRKGSVLKSLDATRNSEYQGSALFESFQTDGRASKGLITTNNMVQSQFGRFTPIKFFVYSYEVKVLAVNTKS